MQVSDIKQRVNQIKPIFNDIQSAIKDREDKIIEYTNEIKELQNILNDNFGICSTPNSINSINFDDKPKQKRTVIPNIDNIIIDILSENGNLTIKEIHQFLESKCNEILREQTTRKRVEGLLERKKIVGDGYQRNTRFKILKEES